jgi:hypothetical protein
VTLLRGFLCDFPGSCIVMRCFGNDNDRDARFELTVACSHLPDDQKTANDVSTHHSTADATKAWACRLKSCWNGK